MGNSPYLEDISGLEAGKDFNVAHCPERVNPGDTQWNIYNINRNIGSINTRMNKTIANVYRTFLPQASIYEVSSLEVAESTKIVENAFRDINIAFVNELARSFDAMGINVKETIDGAANKPFGFLAHYPGCGVGGHCIAVDPYYLIKKASRHGFDHKFLKLAREINNDMPYYAVEKLMHELNHVQLPVNGTTVTLLGLSYKADIADIRNSPVFIIRNKLKKLGAKIKTYDPFIKGRYSSVSSAIKDAQAIIIATAHSDFIRALPEALQDSDIQVIIDGRNCLDKDLLPPIIRYKGIGI